MPTHPVAGVVEFKGKPAPGAFVVFHPVDSGSVGGDARPTGQAKADGSFRLTTREAEDGAPAGEYAVTVEWRRPIAEKDGESRPGPNVLPSRYASPQTTPLRVAVGPGGNELPLRIENR